MDQQMTTKKTEGKPEGRTEAKPRVKRTPYVKVFALGGLDEIGKNMYAVQYGREIIVIDAGVKFPGPDLPGVDYIIPDISYLIEHKDMVKGIFLTHGHEDHIGALPYILPHLDVPIYGGSLTIGFVRAKLEEHRLDKTAQLHTIDENSVIRFRQISVEFFRTYHSIPDSFGIVVQTPQGAIVHTGDFKFDFTPVDKPADWARMAEIGRKGVLLLLADSTNSEKPGFTPSEKAVGDAIKEQFLNCHGRILFATFASNVHRLQQVVEAADMTGRKIAIIGRSMERAFRIGQELGYIRPPKDMIIDVNMIDRYPDNQICIVLTGSQGEANAALTRIANGAHQKVAIYPDDTVMFSASPIPGNTQNVNRSIDKILRAGADVVSGSIMDIHASGHGCREDLKLMHTFMRPTYFMPIHGEHRMLVHHAQLAEELGMNRNNIFVMDIGQTLNVSRRMAKLGRPIQAGPVYVKGGTTSEWESAVTEERRQLADSGVIIVNVVVDASQNKLLAGPDMVTRGFIYVREAGEIINQATRTLKRSITKLQKKEKFHRKGWEDSITKTLSSFFETTMGRSPLILPVLMDVRESEIKRTTEV